MTLGAEELDGLLVTHLPNIRYLTGFGGTNGVVLVRPDGATFLTRVKELQPDTARISASSEASPGR